MSILFSAAVACTQGKASNAHELTVRETIPWIRRYVPSKLDLIAAHAQKEPRLKPASKQLAHSLHSSRRSTHSLQVVTTADNARYYRWLICAATTASCVLFIQRMKPGTVASRALDAAVYEH